MKRTRKTHNQVFNRDISLPYFVTECTAFIIILFNFFWRWALIKLVGFEWEIERCKDKHCTNGGRVVPDSVFTEYLEYHVHIVDYLTNVTYPAHLEDNKWDSQEIKCVIFTHT